MNKLLILLLICLFLVHTSVYSQVKVIGPKIETNEKSLQNDLAILESHPSLLSALRILRVKEDWWVRGVVESEIAKDTGETLWNDVINIIDKIDDFNYITRYRLHGVIGKLASKGNQKVRDWSWDWISDTLNSKQTLKGWNDVTEMVILLQSLTEIDTEEAIMLLIQSTDRKGWDGKTTIVDLADGGVDSWGGNTELYTTEFIEKIRISAINDFIGTSVESLYYSDHPLAQNWVYEIDTKMKNSITIDDRIQRIFEINNYFYSQEKGNAKMINERGFHGNHKPFFDF